MVPYKSALLSDIDHINHGFFSRKGGCSTGIYESLNCGPGSDDNPDNVTYNRQIIRAKIGSKDTDLCGLHQIHSNIVHYLGSDSDLDILPKGDALVTKQKNVALSILTADCAPVLLADPINNVIGAAHAGWKGALTGILENTIAMMCHHGAALENIRAAIGPCIAQKNYEVGPEFLENFIDQNAEYKSYFINSPKEGHHLFNLRGFTEKRLKETGITHIDILPFDTYANKDDFFSYRRTTHRSEEDYGRQISVITI